MPILKDNRSTTTLQLKSYEGAEVIMYSSLLVGELEGFDDSKTSMQQVFYILPKLIKEWNFTDEGGNVLDVTVENLKKLSADALEEMTAIIEKNKYEAKKD
jgi:hypothetical protein